MTIKQDRGIIFATLSNLKGLSVGILTNNYNVIFTSSSILINAYLCQKKLVTVIYNHFSIFFIYLNGKSFYVTELCHEPMLNLCNFTQFMAL